MGKMPPPPIRNKAEKPKRDAKWIPLDTKGLSMTKSIPKCQAGCGKEATRDGLTKCNECCDKPRHASTINCVEYQRAVEFVNEMLPDFDAFRTPKYDRCYCVTCHPLHQGDKNEKGNAIVPRGWVELGVALPQSMQGPKGTDEDIWTWDTVYHGTMACRLTDILGHRHIGMPGDVLPDGTILEGLNSAGRSDAVFYTSPTINYAGLQLYATTSLFDWGTGAAQVVLQCKQDRRPGKVQKLQGETMGFEKNGYCDHAVCKWTSLYEGSHGIETTSKDPSRCVPFKVCVRTFDGPGAEGGCKPPDPWNHPQGLETFHSPVDELVDPNGEDKVRCLGPPKAQWFVSPKIFEMKKAW
jgi:hypothetical protein